MQRKLFDAKNFKHLSSDEDKTVLEHKDGHQLTIAHKKLSKEMQEQLMALAPKKDDKIGADSKKLMSKSESNAAQDVKEMPQMYAEGAMVEDDSQPIDKSEALQALDPSLQRKRELYNRLASGNMPQMGSPFIENDLNEDVQFGPQGEEPKQFDPKSWAQAELSYSKEKENNAAKAVQAQQNAIEVNKQRVAAGLEPIPVPNVPEGPQIPGSEAGLAAAPQGIATAEAPQEQPAEPPQMGPTGAAREIAGINAEAAAKSGMARQQEKALQDAHSAQLEAQSIYKQRYDDLMNERTQFIKDIQDAEVSPDKYWTGDKDGNGGHSKIASAIGMILAGFNPTTQPNAAMNLLKFQMEQNLEAQRQNLGTKKSLLEANLRQFGNINDAMNMTRLMQNDLLQNQLQQAAAHAQSPMALAAAQQAIGQIEQHSNQLQNSLATNQLIGTMLSGQMSPEAIPTVLNSLEQMDPARAKDLRERFVPGIGFAQTGEGGKSMREMQSLTKSIMDGIQGLRSILKSTGKSFSLTKRKEAETIRNAMIGALRVPMTGPGAMNEGERKLMEDMIPGVANISSVDAVSKKGLDALENVMQQKYNNALNSNGIKNQTLLQQEPIKGKDGRMYRKEIRDGVVGYVPIK